MNKKQHIINLWCVLAFNCLAVTGYAAGAEGIQVLKISPQDERAVIKTTDGKTKRA